jgi:hypothetical protein
MKAVIQGPKAELVEIEIGISGSVLIRVNGTPVLVASRVRKISVSLPSQSLVIKQKKKRSKENPPPEVDLDEFSSSAGYGGWGHDD